MYKVDAIKERKNYLKRNIRRLRKDLLLMEEELLEVTQNYKAKKQANQNRKRAKESILERVRKGGLKMNKQTLMKIISEEEENLTLNE